MKALNGNNENVHGRMHVCNSDIPYFQESNTVLDEDDVDSGADSDNDTGYDDDDNFDI